MNAARSQNLSLSFFPPVVAAVLLFLLVNGFAGTGFAAAEKKSCVTSKCHASMGKEKYVHGPASVGECTLCHKPTEKHKFEPITDVGKLCNECHDTEYTGKVIHPPVEEGECTGCHNPHQSPYQFMLRAEGADLCIICHDENFTGGEYVHGPVAVGGCSVCHSPHASDYPKLLMATGNDVCFSCHSDKEDTFLEKKHMHTPVEEGCVLCHSPHSGPFQYMLSGDGRGDLCLACHEDMQQSIAGVKVVHGVFKEDKKCLSCHDPHVADYTNQLIMEPADLCLSCHNREYNDNGKVKVANMEAILQQNKIHHGPIKQKDCSGCHNPHGSDNFRMLQEYFPKFFYAPYKPGFYKLCFMCHEQTIAQEKFTTTLTGFRNGKENLHYLHVNQKVKGRTCRACHDAHATNNPKHIRDSVPFGAWNLPIGFEKTATGGQCLPGCHQMFRYDREKPVRNR